MSSNCSRWENALFYYDYSSNACDFQCKWHEEKCHKLDTASCIIFEVNAIVASYFFLRNIQVLKGLPFFGILTLLSYYFLSYRPVNVKTRVPILNYNGYEIISPVFYLLYYSQVDWFISAYVVKTFYQLKDNTSVFLNSSFFSDAIHFLDNQNK